MEAVAEREIKITLSLSEYEAIWLRNYMRNRLSDEESSDDRAMRAKFFNVMKEVEP